MMEYFYLALTFIGILVGMTVFTMFLFRLLPNNWSQKARSLTFWGCYVTAWAIISFFASNPAVAMAIIFGAIWIVPEAAVRLAKHRWGIVTEGQTP